MVEAMNAIGMYNVERKFSPCLYNTPGRDETDSMGKVTRV